MCLNGITGTYGPVVDDAFTNMSRVAAAGACSRAITA